MNKSIVYACLLLATVSSAMVQTNIVDGIAWVAESRDGGFDDTRCRIIRCERQRHDRPGKKAGQVTVPRTIGNKRVHAIGEKAFQGNVWLDEVVIHSGVSRLEDMAFAECPNLTNVVMEYAIRVPGEHGVENIGEKAFVDCCKLEVVSFSPYLTCIGHWAFQRCRKLQTVTFNYFSSLGEGAFEECDRLERVYLPGNTELRGNAFSLCSNLKFISLDSENEHVMVRDGVLYDKNMKVLVTYPAKRDGTTFVVPEGVECIYAFAFSRAKMLKSVKLPSSLRSVMTGAFLDSGLSAAVMPKGVEYIGEGAFMKSAVTTAVIPSTVKTMGRICFSGCNNLSSIRFEGTPPEVLDEQVGDVFAPSNCVLRVKNTDEWKTHKTFSRYGIKAFGVDP